jgi:hypothetical protein
VPRWWSSNGRLAEIDDRWLVVCGNGRIDGKGGGNCEMLDTHASTLSWTEIDNIPSDMCPTEMPTVGLGKDLVITSGGEHT